MYVCITVIFTKQQSPTTFLVLTDEILTIRLYVGGGHFGSCQYNMNTIIVYFIRDIMI